MGIGRSLLIGAAKVAIKSRGFCGEDPPIWRLPGMRQSPCRHVERSGTAARPHKYEIAEVLRSLPAAGALGFAVCGLI
jgi:hypothetical protein